MNLNRALIETPLGQMVAIADDTALYLLEFADCKSLSRELQKLQQQYNTLIVPGSTAITKAIEHELVDYFSGVLRVFSTPIAQYGTLFQNSVWHVLQTIPFGSTAAYAHIAQAIGNPAAFRAVANASRCNQFAIIVPCHRVIKSNGSLSGYDGGLMRKQWLLAHEKQNCKF